MTGKLASMSASLAAKVMVNSCPSMAGTFLLLVSGGIPPSLEYCMPDTTVPASLLSPRFVGKKVAAVLNWANGWDCMVFRGQWAVVWRSCQKVGGEDQEGGD